METGDIVLRTRKTGRPMAIPLIKQLRDALDQLPASDDPNAFIFPTLAQAKRTGALSNQFREILVEAGLLQPRNHQTRSIGRTGRRERSELSFHSLRHSTVTLLKANGVADDLARAVVGHESAAVNKHYTHISTDDVRRAIERLPDLTIG
jgi:integrase